MNKRIELHKILTDILGSDNVYFQPPENVKLKYPAVIYSRSNINNRFADNAVYSQKEVYEAVVIDKNPDSVIVKSMSTLPYCRFDRHYISENLNHDVFTIYI